MAFAEDQPLACQVLSHELLLPKVADLFGKSADARTALAEVLEMRMKSGEEALALMAQLHLSQGDYKILHLVDPGLPGPSSTGCASAGGRRGQLLLLLGAAHPLP